MKKCNRIFSSLRIVEKKHISIFFTAIIFFMIFLFSCNKRPERKTTFEVKRGMTIHSVGKILQKRDIIYSSFLFKLSAKFKPESSKIQAGTYEFSNRQSYSEMLNMLIEGKVKTFAFTIKEGMSNNEIKTFFVAKKIMSQNDFKKYSHSKALLEKYKIPAKSLEGYLFPETYTFPIGVKPSKVFSKMVKTFFEKIDADFHQKAREIKILKSFHKAIILASIVEKETRASDERPKIASVFLNRLKINKKLESCATIQYILGKPKARLLIKDVKIQHPYNTYKRKGLPPGPICNPGKSSILAVLFASKTNYLFFVRNQYSKEGRHYFSNTYKGHLLKKGN